MAGWTPTLPPGERPLYERLLDALREDIASGALGDGDRLPPQRDLAHRLGLGLGTVTRAYVEAEKAGLVQAHVGRGSFVRGVGVASRPAAEDPGPINLSQNIAPVGPGGERIAQTLARLQRRPDLLDNLAYAPSAGLEAHRRAFATWLSRTAGVERADWRQLICCAGAQHALSLALAALCRPGDEVLCEAATFPGARVLAAHAGYRLTGVAMDGEGLLPDALDQAAANGAKAVFVLPTLQNPTGRIMGAARRADIVAVARRRDLWIIEDGIYAIFGGDAPPPLVDLAPERTIHVSGVSKALSPGLRVGFLLAPPGDLFERVVHAVRAQFYAPPNFGALIATQWIEDGSAEAIAGEIRDEMTIRLALARRILGEAVERPMSASAPHVWLPMSELEAERLAGRALRGGVELTPPSAPIVAPGATAGVRLCLGAARDRDELERGLGIVAAALAGVDERSRAMI
ncbi:PLP-dependent aminotransferase family protein [Caulobacter sp. UNC279MFTsu5.1]|uniref:aminotransferase-like domain-containing protein n=1 Tax=Caulobacter sp. UNC279MFTsu5.1 TaxID=1502775 RepID=UPI0008E39001|nr:PLP-dependent aminotransferase family protein [Caulobacter sp. UNC279MFTsu5.1]SFI83130.1 DNA-binding transcriptional regulator, MocR family, contains an aminotransferase domain [Caulobacter sp. UNC279MFTsu5.1]